MERFSHGAGSAANQAYGQRRNWPALAAQMISWPTRAARYVEQQDNEKLAGSGRALCGAARQGEAGPLRPCGVWSSEALISWSARAAPHNWGKLSRQATISWPALAARHSGGKLSRKAGNKLARSGRAP